MNPDLQNVSLRIKDSTKSVTINFIVTTCNADNLLAFAEAYNSLQDDVALAYIKRSVYQFN